LLIRPPSQAGVERLRNIRIHNYFDAGMCRDLLDMALLPLFQVVALFIAGYGAHTRPSQTKAKRTLAKEGRKDGRKETIKGHLYICVYMY
jgi:hypothetical protein